MKNLIFLLLICSAKSVSAQQFHFVFIQSENKQPFVATLNDKDHTSTTSGYLIIPKVATGEYEMKVHFPSLSIPARKFSFSVLNKDVGFNLKPTGTDWALTNIQTYVTIRPGNDIAAENLKTGKQGIAKKATPNATKAVSIKLKKGINKIMEVQEARGLALRFLDVQDGQTDTIDVIIPVENAPVNAKSKFGNGDNYFTFTSVAVDDAGQMLSLPELTQEGYNVNCVNLASAEDYYRTRRKMASESSDENMIAEAKKAAKNKCYTTAQVKNLCSLFLSDEGRYKFFDAMYPLVYDYLQYPRLEKELTQQPVIEKFRTLIKR